MYLAHCLQSQSLMTAITVYQDLPSFVVIDWEATWDNLYYDYSIEDGHVFWDNF